MAEFWQGCFTSYQSLHLIFISFSAQTRLGEVESLRLQAEAVESALQRPELRSAVALLPPLPAVHECLQQIGVTLHQVSVIGCNLRAITWQTMLHETVPLRMLTTRARHV